MAKKTIKSPSKGETYLVTQESFDAAFHAGRAVAGAFHAAAQALKPLLTPLAGSSDERHIKQWNEYARAFRLGMAAEREIDPDSARRMFGRIVEFLGLDKPQSEEAKRKQVKRAAERASQAPQSDEENPKAGAGAEAAAQVSMVLSSMEAHIVKLIRSGKFEMATEAIAALADAE